MILNTGANKEHKFVIFDYGHIAPDVVLAGKVTVDWQSFIGANSVLTKGVNLADKVIMAFRNSCN